MILQKVGYVGGLGCVLDGPKLALMVAHTLPHAMS